MFPFWFSRRQADRLEYPVGYGDIKEYIDILECPVFIRGYVENLIPKLIGISSCWEEISLKPLIYILGKDAKTH